MKLGDGIYYKNSKFLRKKFAILRLEDRVNIGYMKLIFTSYKVHANYWLMLFRETVVYCEN
jgi:hypothetical protein